MENKILNLHIYKKYFDEILSYQKKIEYREVKKYYDNLFKNKYDYIVFINGYGNTRPHLLIELKYITKNKNFYELHLGKIIKTWNIPESTNKNKGKKNG